MNQKQNSAPRSYEISFVVWVRCISVFLILLCHLTQTHQNAYVVMSSQLFNVGVNIFIIISGYLFGRLGVQRPYKKWLIKRIKRIALPYWIFLAVIVILQAARGLTIKPLSLLLSIFGLHAFKYVFPGSEHTWFITAIILCYLVTPLIDMLVEKTDPTTNKKRLSVAICILALLSILIAFSPESAILNTIPFYSFAFILGKKADSRTISGKQACVLLLVAGFSFFTRFFLRIFIDDTLAYNNIVVPYSYYIAGFCFFTASERIFCHKPWKFVRFISNISFEIYLFHYMFMWPPLSVMSLTGSWYINALIAVILSLIVAWLINRLVIIIRQLPKIFTEKNTRIH